MIFQNVIPFVLVPCVLSLSCVKCGDFDLGNAIDLLKHYGIVAKMLPIGADDPDEFIQTAFSSNVLNKSHPVNKSSRLLNNSEWSDGIWKINLCEDPQQLLASFFDSYSVEMVEKAEKLLFSTWKYKNLEILFGLPYIYLTSDYLLLLIRHEKCKTNLTMKYLPEDESMLNATFLQQVNNITTRDPLSTYSAFVPFGTHFVRSFSRGEVIFQVLVYPKEAKECFQTSKGKEVTKIIYKCAASSLLQASKIKTLSNSLQIENELNEKYHTNTNSSDIKFLNSLLNLKREKTYLPGDICKSNNMTIIGFNLSGINNIIFNRTKSSFVQEMIDNQMSLRDMYL